MCMSFCVRLQLPALQVPSPISNESVAPAPKDPPPFLSFPFLSLPFPSFPFLSFPFQAFMSSGTPVPLSHSQNQFPPGSTTGCPPLVVFVTLLFPPSSPMGWQFTTGGFYPQKANMYVHPEVPTGMLFQLLWHTLSAPPPPPLSVLKRPPAAPHMRTLPNINTVRCSCDSS